MTFLTSKSQRIERLNNISIYPRSGFFIPLYLRQTGLRRLCFILFLLLFNVWNRVLAQNQDKLRTHVQNLTSPFMQGRLTGSMGQKLAVIYIQNQFDTVLVDTYEVKNIHHGGWLASSQDTLYHNKDFFYAGIRQPIRAKILLDSIVTVACSSEQLFELRSTYQHQNTIFLINDWIEFLELFGHEFTSEEVFLVDDFQHENWHLFVRNESWKDFQISDLQLLDYEETWFTENLIVPVYHHSKNSETWIFSAHYDHLGTIDSLYFPGADDNASGVALLIELAKLFQNSAFQFPVNITFIFFSAEEQGLLGSRYFVNHSPYFDINTEHCLNFDMVGFVKDTKIQIIQYLDTFDFTLANNSEIEIEFIPQEAFLHEFSSDHLSFVEQGIPALNFFTGLHAYYHSPQDTPEKLNYDAMNALLFSLFNALKKME